MTKTNAKTATRTNANADTNPLSAYASQLKAWPVKFAGPKPTADNFKTAHGLGARVGSKTAVAIAMMLRDGGATQPQVINLNGGAYLNKARELVEAGHAVRVTMPASADKHTVYKLALPTKKASKRTATKAKAKQPAKRKPATKPAAEATS